MGQAKLYGKKQPSVDIQGLVKDYYAYAGENISAGDFVEFVNGVASRTNYTSNLAYFATSEVKYITTCLIDENRFLIAYVLDSNNYLYIQVGTIENATITFGTAYNFVTRSVEMSSIIKISDGKFLIAYAGYQSKWNIYTVLCTVSANNEITFGTAYTVQTGTSSHHCNSPILKLISSTQALIVFAYGSTLYACVLSLDSTGVSSKGTLYSLTSDYGNSNAYGCGVSVCQLTDTSFFVAYIIKRSSDNRFQYVGKVLETSELNITQGAENNIYILTTTSNGLGKIAVCALNSATVLAVFSNYDNSTILGRTFTITDINTVSGSSAGTLFTQSSGLPNHFDVCKVTETKCTFVVGSTISPYINQIATILFSSSGLPYIPTGSSTYLIGTTDEKNVKYLSLLLINNDKVIASYAYDDHYGYSQAFNCSGNVPIKTFYTYTYETQVRKVTTPQFDGIAQTSGSGGSDAGHNQQVEVLTILETDYVSDEGVSPSLTGSRVGRLKSTLKASDTTQESTIGKNLLPYNQLSEVTENGITFTPVYEGNNLLYVKAKGTATATVTYRFYGTDTTTPQKVFDSATKISFGLNGSSSTYGMVVWGLNSGGANIGTVIYSETDYATGFQLAGIGLRIISGTNVDIQFKPMIRLASITDDTYEPYTGGIPSPSPFPEFPQDIHVVKGNNTVEVYGLNVINLLNYTRLVNNSCTDRVIDKNDISFTNSGIWGNISLMFENINKNQDYYLYYKVSSIVSRTCGIRVYGTDILEFSTSDITVIYDGLFDLPANEIKEKNGTFNSGNYKYIILRFWGNASSTSLGTATEIKYQDVMLKKGTSEASFEPYTGTPYPVNLSCNLFTKNNIVENYRLDTGGANFAQSGYFISDYIEVTENTNYIVNYSPDAYTRICFYNSSKTYLSKNDTLSTFTTPSYTKYIRFCNLLTNIDIVRLEQGNTIKGDIELCKISTYQDTLFKAVVGDTVYDSLTSEQKDSLVSGGWYKYNAVKKGYSTNIYRTISVTSTIGSNLYAYACNLNPEPSSESTLGIIISNIFAPKVLGTTSDTTNPNNVRFNMGISKHSSTQQVVISIKKSYLTTGTPEDFISFLTNNNFYCLYVLATPTITQITDTTLISQLENLYSAMSKNGQTNVLQTNTDVPFTIFASALKGE